MMEQVRNSVLFGEVAWLFLEPDTGLDHYQRILLSGFRSRTSDSQLTISEMDKTCRKRELMNKKHKNESKVTSFNRACTMPSRWLRRLHFYLPQGNRV